jgi:hypothetical protein
MTEKRITKKTPTMCWSCANAVPGPETGCSWSRRFEPVKGWTAMPTKIEINRGRIDDSFLVLDCPEYVEG